MKCKMLLFVYCLPKCVMNHYLCLKRKPKVFSGINLPVCDSFARRVESSACACEGNYPITSLPLKNCYFSLPFQNSGLYCSKAWEGDVPSSLNTTGQIQSHSCACKHLHAELLLSSTSIFLTSSWGVGAEAGFIPVHPGLPRSGSNLLSSPV